MTNISAPMRERLPQSRAGKTYSVRIGGVKGYVTTGEYPDGRIGELFVAVAKQGSTLAGVLDAWAISISLGLQYGVPLESYVKKYVGQKFEPDGMTNDVEITTADSIVDYIFRRLAFDYLPQEMCAELGVRRNV